MSNFIQNLAKRGAGLPLAAEARPAPAPVFESSLEAPSEGLSEITSEEMTIGAVETTRTTFETPHTPATPDVPHSPLEQVDTGVKPAPAAASRDTPVLQPAPSIVEIVSAIEHIPPPEAKSDTVAPRAEASVSQSFQAVSRDSEVTIRAESTHASGAESAQPSSTADINPPATISPRLDQPESSWPETSPHDVDEAPSTASEPAATDVLIRPAAPEHRPVLTEHLIRPAATEPTISLQFPKVATAPPPPPIHVRIGRVEVRGTPPVHQPTPIQAPPKESPPLGFAGYQRLRRYRN